jgi:hypothetical protein
MDWLAGKWNRRPEMLLRKGIKALEAFKGHLALTHQN